MRFPVLKPLPTEALADLQPTKSCCPGACRDNILSKDTTLRVALQLCKPGIKTGTPEIKQYMLPQNLEIHGCSVTLTQRDTDLCKLETAGCLNVANPGLAAAMLPWAAQHSQQHQVHAMPLKDCIKTASIA